MNPFVQTVERCHGRFQDVCQIYKPSTQEKHLSYCRVSGTERERVGQGGETCRAGLFFFFFFETRGSSEAGPLVSLVLRRRQRCTLHVFRHFNAFNNRVATSTDDPCVFPPVCACVCLCACCSRVLPDIACDGQCEHHMLLV